MIFPAPVNPQKFLSFPMTWALVLINFLLFVLFFSNETNLSNEHAFLSEKNLKRTGLLYHNLTNPSDNLTQHSEREVLNWAMQAIKDRTFFSKLEQITPLGDALEFTDWKNLALDFRSRYVEQPSFQFGLSSQNHGEFHWLTYQFSHASWVHLFSNLVFLIILGAAVERLAGSSVLLGLYLCGGITGGMTFLFFNSHGIAPLVGASASISALMAFYAIFEPRRRIKYFFVLTPFELIYLSPLLIIPLYIVSDWVSWIATPEEWPGSIAYTAHIGGAFLGFAVAFAYKYLLKTKPLSLRS